MSWETLWFVGAPLGGVGLLAVAGWPRRRRGAERWFRRLDPQTREPTAAQRMALASSLAVVRARWAGELLRRAYAEETDARVRGRLLAALVSGGHFEDRSVFERAYAAGGLDAAALRAALEPRATTLPWVADLIGRSVESASSRPGQGRLASRT